MLKELGSCLKDYRKEKNIFDMVVYGSSSDTEIAVIFKVGVLKDRLAKVQEIKKKIKFGKVKGFLFDELFQEQFFGRSELFLEGVSIFDGKPFSHKIDFEGFALFVYNLRDKTHNEKVKFNYLLSGRNDQGVVEWLEGEHVSPGVVKIPVKNAAEFEEILKKHNVNFFKYNILVQRGDA